MLEEFPLVDKLLFWVLVTMLMIAILLVIVAAIVFLLNEIEQSVFFSGWRMRRMQKKNREKK